MRISLSTRRALASGLVLSLCAAAPTVAQEARSDAVDSGITLGGGIGVSSAGIFVGAQFGIHGPGRDWIVRGAMNSDIAILSQSDAVGGFALLRGWRTDKPGSSVWRRIAFGLSVDYAEIYADSGSNCGLFGCSQELDAKWGIGLAAQGDIGVDIGSSIGLSLTGQGSLNTAKPWIAVGVMLTLGPTSMNR